MRHDYLKWAHEKTLGAVSIPDSDIIPLDRNRCLVSCGDQIVEWNLRSFNSKCHVQIDPTKCSTRIVIVSQPGSPLLAFGENDGSVSLLELSSGEIRTAFKGHTSAISALAFSPAKLMLASGSKDSKICLWDIAGESGLYKLSGHRGEITSLAFLLPVCDHVLVSTSRDGFVKFWDLETQHCFRTLVEHSGAVWKAVLFHSGSRMATAGADGVLRVWHIQRSSAETPDGPENKLLTTPIENDESNKLWGEVDAFGPVKCTLVGSLELPGRGPPRRMVVDNSERYLICARRETMLFYRIRSAEELRKKQLKRAKKRAIQSEGEPVLPDEIRPSGALRMSSRVVSFYATRMEGDSLRVLAAFGDNCLESINVSFLATPHGQPNLISTWQLPQTASGHRGEVRCVQFSSDGSAVISVGADYIKMWNRRSGNCVRTLHVSGVTCGLFLPGDRHVLVGNTNGSLITVDLGSGDTQVAKACHDGAVASLAISPDNRTVASCGVDKAVRFWSVHVPIVGQPTLASSKESTESTNYDVVQERVLSLEDEPLCAQFSPDGRLIAISLLDSTIRIFYTDTLRFFLSLYGHKLPCPSIAISSDSQLIVSASRDRNIKIWGLDFGDCHRSIFAHDEVISSVAFLPNTHHFFSAGADSKINRWDADIGQLISSSHHPGVTCLAVSPAIRFSTSSEAWLVSGGTDGSLRIWGKTEEILVLSEEREEAEEKAIAEAAANSSNQPVEPQGVDTSVSLPIVPTVDALKAAEDIVESVDIWKKEQDAVAEGDRSMEVDPLVKAYGYSSAEELVGETLLKIKPAFLQGALMRLPVSTVVSLLKVVNSPSILTRSPELVTRVTLFLLRLHNGRLPNALEVLDHVKKAQQPAIKNLRDLIGVNLAGLQILGQALEEQEGVTLFDDLTPGRTTKNKKKRKTKVLSTLTATS